MKLKNIFHRGKENVMTYCYKNYMFTCYCIIKNTLVCFLQSASTKLEVGWIIRLLQCCIYRCANLQSVLRDVRTCFLQFDLDSLFIDNWKCRATLAPQEPVCSNFDYNTTCSFDRCDLLSLCLKNKLLRIHNIADDPESAVKACVCFCILVSS